MSNTYNEKSHYSSIYIRFNTRYVILYAVTLILYSNEADKDNKAWIFQHFGTKQFFMLKQAYCCLTFVCMYISACTVFRLMGIHLRNLFLLIEVNPRSIQLKSEKYQPHLIKKLIADLLDRKRKVTVHAQHSLYHTLLCSSNWHVCHILVGLVFICFVCLMSHYFGALYIYT